MVLLLTPTRRVKMGGWEDGMIGFTLSHYKIFLEHRGCGRGLVYETVDIELKRAN